MALKPGLLVEISGLQQEVQPVQELKGYIDARNLNGEKAQLLEFDRESGKWIVGTFGGAIAAVTESHITPLALEALEELDFVLGPKSDSALVGSQLAERLRDKGYASIKLIVTENDAKEMIETAKRLEDEDQFARLAIEFEPGYLGRGSAAKCLHVDPNCDYAPMYVQQSSLAVMDNNFSAVSGMLAPYAPDMLGFEIYSRTSLLLRMPILSEDEGKYPSADVDEQDAEGYLHIMSRRRLILMQFVGPSSGTLRLISKRSKGVEMELKADPHTMVCIDTAQYDYSLQAGGPSLTLQTFFLQAPLVFEVNVENLGEGANAMDLLKTQAVGPPMPKGPQITANSLYCRYGGGSDGALGYWAAVALAGADGVTCFPPTRFEWEPYYDPDLKFGGSYTKHCCFGIEGIELFDAKFFEISPAEARGMAPTQRQVMEVSYLCLKGAGFDKKALGRKSEHIGHFVGIDKDDWQFMGDILAQQGITFGTAGATTAITSNRFSFSLNLKGASMTVDTACSSSLTCTHLAKMHLRMQDWEPMPLAIVNGLNVCLLPTVFMGCCSAGMLSHEGRCFTFNATADGYNRAEACGAIGFKQKKFDQEDMAAIYGTQCNQDGRSASLTAPNGPAQERCIQAVLRESGLTPSEIDMFECHGTGTALGDPIEIGSFRKVMSITERVDPLFIVSSKSHISHSEGGAGLAGLFKCCLQTSRVAGAPNLHLKKLNPHLDLDGFPCQPLSELNSTRDPQATSGVSSFGFGGTNAHAETWGKSIFEVNISNDVKAILQKKLKSAPPAGITINGDDIDDWDTTGFDPRAQDGDSWQISIDPDGVVEWEKVEKEPDEFEEFAIQGSFNNWEPEEPMQRHERIPGLWTAMVTIGDTGEEEFQIIADSDPNLVYHPDRPRCTSKSEKPKGPAKVGQDNAWLLSGRPGQTFKVEFYQDGTRQSLLWLPVST